MANSQLPMQGLTERTGVFRGEDGNLYIPGTRRPNGTYRKPIRVKDGYIPQDEQPAYENKGVKWIKDRPACPGLAIETPEQSEQSKANERNRKKKEARKKAAEKKNVNEGATTVNEVTDQLQSSSLTESAKNDNIDVAKRLKNLKKRLAQIDSLKAKMDSGELSNPDPDQVRKVERRDEVAREIEELEERL